MKLFSHKIQLGWTPPRRYHQIIHLDNSIKSPAPTEIKFYLDQLRLLANLLPASKFSSQIEGGMAVALHDGKFSRHHGDVDVAVFEHQLVEVEAQLKECGYRLFSRNSIHAFEYLPWDVFNSFSAEEILARKRVKRLTAVKVNARGVVDTSNCIIPRVDVHIHRIEKNSVRLDRGRVRFPADLFAQTRTIELEDQHCVTVASLPLMYYYKLSGKRPRHRFDLALIKQNEDFSSFDRERVERIFNGASRSEGLFHVDQPASDPVLIRPNRMLLNTLLTPSPAAHDGDPCYRPASQ